MNQLIMPTIPEFRDLALAFPEAVESPHFDKASFRVRKKIFATLDENKRRVSIKLNEVDQSVFCDFDQSIVSPVPNKWGKQGWTLIDLEKVGQEMLIDMLTCAYCQVAPKKLSAGYEPQ